MATHLPSTKQVRDLLVDLLDRSIEISPAPPLAPGPRTPASVGVYVDDAMRVSALIVCDIRFSAYAGAALALVSPTQAEQAVTREGLDEALAENLYEVLNIAASMFNAPGADHLKLHALHPAGPPLDPMTRIQTLTLGRREDLSVEIGGYGTGLISMVMIA